MEIETGRRVEKSGMSAREFYRLSEFIYSQCGIKMPASKRIMLESRLGKRLRKLGIGSFEEYCNFLFSPEGMQRELAGMIDAVTTNKTDFFREPQHFDYLARSAVPQMLRASHDRTRRRVMVWSAGCSTGEEPYTLAMVLSEFAERRPGFSFSVLATDISTRVLEAAKKAIYNEDRVSAVPAALQRKYLMRSRDRQRGLVRVAPELRAAVMFRRLNFMDCDFGMREPIDIIFCRNVIIYFDRPTQERLLKHFYRLMAPGGYIFMGHSETLNGLDVPLALVAPTVYRKSL